VQLHGGSWQPADVQRILGPGGIADQLDEMRDEGLVRHIGLTSEDNNDSLYELIRSGRFDVLQICYNLLHQHPYEPTRPFGSMLVAEEHGVGIVTMRGATSGVLQKWVRAVRPDDDFDYTPALIAFVLSNPLVDVALVGMRSAEEVKANARLAEDMTARLDIAALHRKYPSEEANGRDR
jgi:predicted aldo/keto reductase-like oxidoreductase